MGDQDNRDGLRQQPADDQRQQAGQQNQQGETRAPQQQRDDDAREAPGQQNQQGQRPRHEDNEGVEGTPVEGLDDGLEGGVDTGAIEPGKTGLR